MGEPLSRRRVKKLWEEDPSTLITNIMETRDISPDDIRDDKTKVDILGMGYFICRKCQHRWQSRNSKITVDLKEKTICKEPMQCDRCLRGYEPYVEEKNMARVIEEAINKLTGKLPDQPVAPAYERVIREEDLTPIFTRILKQHQLRPEDIREERKKVNIFGTGSFSCTKCRNPKNELECHRWTSHFSWLTFDLKERTICKRWIMKCKSCLTCYTPYFELEDIKTKFELAVIRYKNVKVHTIDIGRRGLDTRPDPHIRTLCEKCRWGVKKCWVFQ